jgi:hypothetical protein
MFNVLKKIVLKNCRIILSPSIYDNVGDSIVRNLTIPKITQETYTIRHIIVKGGFTINFPNSSEPSKSGKASVVFPYEDYDATSFEIVADQPNSSYYCVLPEAGKTLNQTKTNLTAGQTLVIEPTQVGFIFGQNFTVNGKPQTDFYVAACENNAATIVATQPCTVVMMQSSYFNGM